MLEKASDNPKARLLSLFDILDDWQQAPGIAKRSGDHSTSHPLLLDFCVKQAALLKAENPKVLAEHIVIIARSATMQTLHQPESKHLLHAKKAVEALILAQTQTCQRHAPTRGFRYTQYLVAASLIVTIGITTPLILNFSSQTTPSNTQTHVNDTINKHAITTQHANKLSALDAARMYTKYEQMRQGTCHFPEALLIPDKHKAIYLENVVGGKLPNDLNDLAIANTYLEKVRCNYTPMLMAASR
ncbi:MAG: hypothetical protein CVU29_00555 [Betaproteobacteria bacterium HGW-Betaproteobacteria-22]|nr:MAG: hypothetical protein CVU29_00555 [Betaproteobacteria bacterium HGW-Betaproteobacteria-22]